MKKNTHGGARPGAGIRKNPKPTKTISFRVLQSSINQLIESGIENPTAFYKEAGERAFEKILNKS